MATAFSALNLTAAPGRMLSTRRLEELEQELRHHEKNLSVYTASNDRRLASTQRRIAEIQELLPEKATAVSPALPVSPVSAA